MEDLDLGLLEETEEAEAAEEVVTVEEETTTTEDTDDISISRQDFAKLLGSLDIIRNCCNDVDIINGKVRQKTDDRQAIIDVDLTSILNNENLTLVLLKKKVPLLKSFELDDSVSVDDESVKIIKEPESFLFADALSKIRFRKPLRDLIDNKFMEDGRFNDLVERFLTDENLILNTTVSSYMCKRIRYLCEGFENDAIHCVAEGSTANVSVAKQNHEESSVVLSNIALNREIDGLKKFDMLSLPFTIDINSDVEFKVYQGQDDDTIIAKLSQRYFGIPVTIYTRVKFE